MLKKTATEILYQKKFCTKYTRATYTRINMVGIKIKSIYGMVLKQLLCPDQYKHTRRLLVV